MTSLSSRVYDRLLALYPEDLRRDYGAEMALVFADDLAAARREAGWRGVLRVWRCAVSEFVRLALPGCASSPALRAPILSAGFAIASLSLELLMRCATGNRARFAVTGLLASFSPVFIALAVIWACRGSSVISLDLSDDEDR